jgi:flagellar hook assembly protein FlgD
VKSGPNPFKIGDTYNIQLDVKTGETGTVTIYNVIGQVVRTYSVTGGSNQLVKWDGKDSRGNTCGSGIYFYKLSTPSVNQSKKIVVVK